MSPIGLRKKPRAKGGSPPAEIQLLPPPVSDDIIIETIEELRSTLRDGVLDTAIAMGRIVIERLYGGDLDAWRERGESDQSVRKLSDALAAEKDASGTPSAAGISRAVGVYDLEQRLGVSALKQLTATHCYAVLGLPEKQQEDLLKKAQEKGWSTRQLEEKAKAERKKAGDKRGRPPLPGFEKSLNRLGKMLEKPEESFADLDEEHLKKLDGERAQHLYETAGGMKRQREALQAALAEHVPGFIVPSEE